VTDLDSKAIQFCSKAFTVGTSKSSKDFNELNLSDTYDLIWCGSLLTHFNEAQILELLRFFYRHLNRGGICIFTTHGTRVEALLSSGEINYSLNPKQCQAILHQYKETGIGYSEYEPSRDGYGISLSSDAKIRHLAAKAGDWKCQLFHPAGWDHHQDVYSYFKHS
jgi:SAM-dependent methyltransferase